MKKFVFVSMILLVAAVSVNADVTGMTWTVTGTTAGTGMPDTTGGWASNTANVTATTLSVKNGATNQAAVFAQNFTAQASIPFNTFAVQLSQITTGTDNIYWSSSWTTANHIQVQIQVFQFTGSDLASEWMEPADQRGGTNPLGSGAGVVGSYAPDWTSLGIASSIDITNALNKNSKGWVSFDLSGLGIHLTTGQVYSVRMGLSGDGSHSEYMQFAASNISDITDNALRVSYSRGDRDSQGLAGTSALGPLGAAEGINTAVGTQDSYGGRAFNYVITPEPVTIALLSLGGLLLRRRK